MTTTYEIVLAGELHGETTTDPSEAVRLVLQENACIVDHETGEIFIDRTFGDPAEIEKGAPVELLRAFNQAGGV